MSAAPSLCSRCRFQVVPIPTTEPSGAHSPEARKVEREIVTQLRETEKTERDLAQNRGTLQVDNEPTFQPWCEVGGPAGGGAGYYLCAWLRGRCSVYRCRVPRADCSRCATGAGACEVARDDGSIGRQPPLPVGKNPAVVVASDELADPQTAAAPHRTDGVLLGNELSFGPVMRAVAVGDEGDFGRRPIFQYDYQLGKGAGRPLTISGHGLHQTYLIFGAPGSGKTILYKQVLQQILALPTNPRPGALILDPKGVLVAEVDQIVSHLARSNDRIVIDGGVVAGRNVSLNLLDCPALSVRDLGRLIAEVVLSEAGDLPEGWQIHVADLIESAMVVIYAQEGRVTARQLLREIMVPINGVYPIANRAAVIRDDPREEREEVADAVRRLTDFFTTTEPSQRRFVRQIIFRSLGGLMEQKWAHLSDSKATANLYSGLAEHGKIVLISVGLASPAFQRSLCTLVKALFQQTILSVGQTAINAGRQPNMTLLACDEYAQVLTESISGLVSDSSFFSQSRQYRCMSVLALQSLATARSRFGRGLQDRWDAVLGNVAAKIFMRLADPETARLASTLIGEREAIYPTESTTDGGQLSISRGGTLSMRSPVPPWVLTQRLEVGQGLMVGTLDGGKRVGTVFFAFPLPTPRSGN
jgi:TraM recognition site of TraD and TraG